MKEISATPWRYDGHGINDASGNRLATMGQEAYGHFDSKDPTRWCRNPLRDNDAEVMAAAPAIRDLLSRILRAHDSGNNGAVMGEAVLCEYFTSAARSILSEMGGEP